MSGRGRIYKSVLGRRPDRRMTRQEEAILRQNDANARRARKELGENLGDREWVMVEAGTYFTRTLNEFGQKV